MHLLAGPGRDRTRKATLLEYDMNVEKKQKDNI